MSRQRKLLLIDTETTGTDPLVHGIVSLAALVLNQGAIEDEFYALINDTDALVQEEAMAVHKIPLETIRSEGEGPSNVVAKLTQLLLRHDMRNGVVVVAHGAEFDVGFLKRLFRLAGVDFSKWFSYRTLCTRTGALLLEQAGRIDLPGGSASLDNLAKLWNIPLLREAGHNALVDARATAAILKREVNLIGGKW